MMALCSAPVDLVLSTTEARPHISSPRAGLLCYLSLGDNRRFPAPSTVEPIPGGFKVIDASGQALVYVYARETSAAADIAKVLTNRRGKADRSEHRQAAQAGLRQD